VPYVLLEAMESGLPVVASSSGNLPEVLGDGACGRLVEPGHEAGFARAVEELIQSSTLRERLEREARQRALAYYSEGAVIPSVLKVIEQGVETRAR
jgi:glycosyltransferase involved in cell wall biosynthesis